MAIAETRPLHQGMWFGLGLALIGAAVFILAYLAIVIDQVDTIVDGSLPCEPEVLTDTSPHIDPAVYSLGLFSPDEIEASKASEACVADTRILLDTEVTVGSGDLVYWPLIGMADFLAAGLLVVGWIMGVLGGGLRRAPLLALAGASVLAVAAFSVQIQHSETIDLISVVTD